MGPTLHALTLALCLLLFLALRVPYALRIGGEGATPETAASALTVLSRPAEVPFLAAFDDRRPLLPPLVLTGVYAGLVELGLAGEGTRDGVSLASRAAGGSALAVRAGAFVWIGIETVLLVALFLLVRRLLRVLELPTRMAVAAPLVLVVMPVALAGARRLDGAMLAAALALWGIVVATHRPGPTDHVRWLLGGALLGAAVTAHPVGIAFLPLVLLAFATHAPAEAVVRAGVALVAVGIGALIGDPRLVDGVGALAARAGSAGMSGTALGRISCATWIARGITPLVLVFAGYAALSGWRAGRRGRVAVLVLALPPIVVPLLPGAGFTYALLVAPFVAALAVLGFAAAGRTRLARIAVPLAIVAVVWPAVVSIGETMKVRRGDSRQAATAWLVEHLEPGARVVTDPYGPAIPGEHVTFVLPFDSARPEIYAGAYDIGWYDGFDTFVLVSTQTDRYARSPERHARQIAFVNRLTSVCEVVASFDRRDYTGPAIVILERRGTPTGSELEQLLRRLPPSPQVPDFYLSLGGAYQKMGEVETAKRFLTVAAYLAPGDPRLALNLSSIYIDEGSYMLADSLLELAVHATPQNAKLRYQFGLVKQERRLFGDAIGEYKMAVRYDPTYVEAFFNLAICYFEVGNLTGARNAFRRVTELAPAGHMRSEALRMIEELDAL